MEGTLVPIIITLIIILICAFKKIKEYSDLRSLHNLVAWIVTSNKMDVYSHSLPLWAYIKNAQIELGVPEDYRISGEEQWDVVNSILVQFQKELVQNYFNGSLGLVKSKYAITGESYFLLELTSFLEKHQCDYSFLGHDMHKEAISYKKYGTWGAPLFDATYSLTDFAIVYHKTYYIAYLFCKNSMIFNPKGNLYRNDQDIKNILDTCQINLSRY